MKEFHLAALRSRAENYLIFPTRRLAEFMIEAANEIERQRAEIKRLNGELHKHQLEK